MPIDLNTFVLSSFGTAFKVINSNSSILFNIDTAGSTTMPQQIGFIASVSPDPGWIWLTHNVYTVHQFNVTNYNAGSCFNTSNGRFTAPVNGTYFFHATSYIYKNVTNNGPYVYVWFARNGSGNYLDVKIRGYAYTAGNYFSGEISQFTYLNAGDYIEYVIYCSSTNDTSFEYYPSYSHFEGYLVG